MEKWRRVSMLSFSPQNQFGPDSSLQNGLGHTTKDLEEEVYMDIPSGYAKGHTQIELFK